MWQRVWHRLGDGGARRRRRVHGRLDNPDSLQVVGGRGLYFMIMTIKGVIGGILLFSVSTTRLMPVSSMAALSLICPRLYSYQGPGKVDAPKAPPANNAVRKTTKATEVDSSASGGHVSQPPPSMIISVPGQQAPGQPQMGQMGY